MTGLSRDSGTERLCDNLGLMMKYIINGLE